MRCAVLRLGVEKEDAAIRQLGKEELEVRPSYLIAGLLFPGSRVLRVEGAREHGSEGARGSERKGEREEGKTVPCVSTGHAIATT